MDSSGLLENCDYDVAMADLWRLRVAPPLRTKPAGVDLMLEMDYLGHYNQSLLSCPCHLVR